ncbi:MAG: hypothetical protein ACLTDR_02455 [Adlercreutzia equolifaciens]
MSAMNGLGRLINGFIWDKFGYRVCLTWIAVAFAAGMLCCAFAMMGGNFPLLVAGLHAAAGPYVRRQTCARCRRW